MKLTKYEHACFTIEKDGQILVVDPGGFSNDFISPENVVAVVITHQHFDHLDSERLAEIFAKNDDVLVLGPADVMDAVEIENKRVVSAGDKATVGPFELEFFGGTHALIHDSLPRPQNLGVMVNDLVYYPGDSFEPPNKPVDTLAIPVTAPWLKIGEVIDFLSTIKPRLAFPTHDAIASDNGKKLVDRMLSESAEAVGSEYRRIESSLEL